MIAAIAIPGEFFERGEVLLDELPALAVEDLPAELAEDLAEAVVLAERAVEWFHGAAWRVDQYRDRAEFPVHKLAAELRDLERRSRGAVATLRDLLVRIERAQSRPPARLQGEIRLAVFQFRRVLRELWEAEPLVKAVESEARGETPELALPDDYELSRDIERTLAELGEEKIS